MARRRTYTPELLAYVRHRFEQTEDSVVDIGLDLGISREAVRLLAKREHWKRYVRPPRGLPPVSMEAAHEQPGIRGEGAATLGQGKEGILPLADTITRLHRAVLNELTAIESLRMRPRHASSFAHTTRTLATLTETLQKLQRLQPNSANFGPDDADMPADIDEFRNELARRIEAFIAEQTDADDGRAAGTPSVAPAV